MVKEALILMVRCPEPGKVKSRLAAGIGEAEALRVYRYLLAHTESLARSFAGQVFLFYAGLPEAIPDSWKSSGFRVFPQPELDSLGGRMLGALRFVFREGFTRVLIIGSDCALLQPQHLRQAVEALQETDAVLGPATDGGYYLLGLRRLIPPLFANIPWSTDQVLSATQWVLEQGGYLYKLLPTLPDVDEQADLKYIPAFAHLAS